MTIAVVAIGCFSHSPNIWNAIGVLVAIVWHVGVFGIGVNYGSYVNARDANSEFLSKTETCRLQELRLEDTFIAECTQDLPARKTLQVSLFRRSSQPHNWKPLRVFVAHFSRPPYPTALKAYCSLIGTSFIFLLDAPDHSNPLDTFQRHHEVAHTTQMGNAAMYHSMIDWKADVLSAAVCAFCLAMGNFPWYCWLFLAGFVLLRWLDAHLVAPSWCEAAADIYGFRCLSGPSDRAEVFQLFQDRWSPLLKSHVVPPKLGVEWTFRLIAMKEETTRTTATPSRMSGWNSPLQSFMVFVSPAAFWLGWRLTEFPALLLVLLPVSAGFAFVLAQRFFRLAVAEEHDLAAKIALREGIAGT